MSDYIEEKIIAIIRKAAGKQDADIGPETILSDLGLESLDTVEMLFFIEDEFGVDVPYNANDPEGSFKFTSVADVVAGVKTLVDAKVGAQ